MPQDGAPHPEFVVIHTYTRREALADGVLVDATVGELAEVTRQHFKIHVAMTAEVHALLERAVENPRCHNDYRGVWHDVCSLLRTTITRSRAEVSDTLLFQVRITGAGPTDLWTLKALCGPDDEGAPCLTILLPDED
jgi:hypothetical protein